MLHLFLTSCHRTLEHDWRKTSSQKQGFCLKFSSSGNELCIYTKRSTFLSEVKLQFSWLSFLDSHDTGIYPEHGTLTLQRPNCDWVLQRWTVRASFLPGLHLTPLKSSKGSLQTCNTLHSCSLLCAVYLCIVDVLRQQCPRCLISWLRQRVLASPLKRRH